MPKSTGQARHEIAAAAQDAIKSISAAAAEAAKVLTASAASAASTALKANGGVSDHDAILKLTTSFDNFKEQDSKDKLLIRDDIKQLGDGIVNRVDIIEQRVEKCLTKFEFGTFMTENHAPVLVQVADNTKKLSDLEKSNIRYIVVIGLYGVALAALYALVINHVVK